MVTGKYDDLFSRFEENSSPMGSWNATSQKVHINYDVDKNFDAKRLAHLDISKAKPLVISGAHRAAPGSYSPAAGNSVKQQSAQLQAGTVEISEEGRELLQKEAAAEEQVVQPYKKAGVTSPQEQWERDAAESKEHQRHGFHHTFDFPESDKMRMDDPELYDKIEDLWKKGRACVLHTVGRLELAHEEGASDIEFVGYRDFDEKDVDEIKKKGRFIWAYEYDSSPAAKKKAAEYFEEAERLKSEWKFSKLDPNSFGSDGSIDRKITGIEYLEAKYSDSLHQTSVNFYGPGEEEYPVGIYTGASMWRYSTKFNMLLTTKMLDTLAGGTDKMAVDLLKRIDEAMDRLKGVEKSYEGRASALMFGVRLDDRGGVTYHAKYGGCKEKYGIGAASAEELSRKLRDI